jgi:hypothetical protein
MKEFCLRNMLILLLASQLVAVGCSNDTSQSVSAQAGEDRISVMVNGEEFTTYLFGLEHKYPFFYPVNGPQSGTSVTTWNQEPYPHHSSLYISLDYVQSEGVERGNYWQPRHELETGQVFSRNARILEDDGKRVVIQDETDWIVPQTGTQHFREQRTIAIWAPSATVRIMDFSFEFDVLVDLRVSQATGHSFFSARMNPGIAVGDTVRGAGWAHLGTGQIIDSEGNLNEAETREGYADWAAFYGQNNGATEGLAMIQHPSNSLYPEQWITRDYGFISPSPFGFLKEPFEMKEGQKLMFKYRVVVFSGTHEEADIAGWHQDYIQTTH